ncbi:DUF445 domain-containing protein [Acidithiobacillus sp. CV18-2]|uniref:DUF445 domain-containing protein n=1 Tax=Igneacidithiobacillus copahuensis TaxID=2724909 RepID=A0AAE2YP75_9PROT|nr:DUF445 domain-containing protein [Igneacidithiobacillus copahuensis]MBU2753610.1 DUF445 domain-containing protein [Acidithiobacillus sp. CV18-3]MBU2758538.1 DUF445 domain-containing protein [Acidithiobacillus sp. BN09-2]MBU2776328.1 DUF445 domain-containing protein [Acidithiobacillus sp. CV18-2]MBU2795244.1 DUF445 domain-containing protein [Acidithiobacillus sp. VAN18-2]MBU2799530.1 DUF445 domain-containing protein [Acidithiobacillus sp. VAN18-4]UTV81329.1 DUF445 domain-containing protein 
MQSPTPSNRLRRNRRAALALLLLAFALFVWAALENGQGGYAWLLAASEAAMVGALADWFAVVALFRHPLGIPFPHTAILPRRRDQLARRLAEFIREHFLQEDAILRLVQRYSLASGLASWLRQAKNRALFAEQVQQLVYRALQLAQLEPLRQSLAKSLGEQLRQLDLSRWTAQLLQLLTEDGRHQALLSDAIARLDDWLTQESVQEELAEQIERLLQRAYPTLFSWLGAVVDPANLSRNLARNLVRAAQETLSEIHQDPEHPKRQAFDRWLQESLLRLQQDPRLQARIRRWQEGLLAHPAARDYVSRVVNDLQQWLLQDLQAPRSRSRQLLRRGAGWFGELLDTQPQLRQAIDGYVEESARRLLPTVQESFTKHIEDTIRAWPMADMIRVLEEGIGSDLQYIRINGTVVGLLLGLLIHALFMLLATA